MRPVAVILLLWMLTGCAARQPAKMLNLVIEPRCLSAPLVMQSCDSVNPPKCKNVKVTYRTDCAHLAVQ